MTQTMPPFVRFLNSLGRLPEPLSPVPQRLDADAMTSAAMRQTGLRHLGDPRFMDALRLIVDDLNDMERLHGAGRMLLQHYLTGELVKRLQLEAAWSRHPEILEEPITAPVIILGMPRTGTTLLQRLLAGLPGFQALSYWEGSQPVAPATLGRQRPDLRRLNGRLRIALANAVSPQLRVVHDLRLEGPEECLHLLNASFVSWIYLVQAPLQRYRDHFLSLDQGFVYQDLRKQLQLLQWQRGRPDRWVLKSPGHMFGLEGLRSAFPDAVFLETRRSAEQSVASACSLFETVRQPFLEPGQRTSLGPEVLDQLVIGQERVAGLVGEGRLDLTRIDYAHLAADPVAVAARLCESLDLCPADQAVPSLKQTIAGSPRHKYGRHHYDAADFGITDEALARLP